MTDTPKPSGQELGSDPAKWPVGVVLVTGYDGQLFAGELNARGYQEWWVTANGKILSDEKDRWMEWPS